MMNDDHEREEERWITNWEQQCIQEVESEPDLEERIHNEKDLAVQKSWQMFQNTATTIAQLYKESMDIQKRSIDLAMQCGSQRRTHDLLSWAKKHRRHIRREDLIAYLADKSPPPRPRGSPRQRLVLDRNAPGRLGGLSSQEPITSHTHNPEADLQTFREALTLASLNGAMSNVSMGYGRGHAPGSPPLGPHSSSRRRNPYSDLNTFICEEYAHHCEARKRNASSTDVLMDSPTHKRSRLM